jgi:hypothetical protein
MSIDAEAPHDPAPQDATPGATVPVTPADGIPVESWLFDGAAGDATEGDPAPHRSAWGAVVALALLPLGITGGVLALVLWLAPMAFGALPVGCGGG